MDIATQFNALKMIWLRRLLDNNYHPWKLMPRKLFSPLGGVTFLHSNLELAGSSLRIVKNLSPFYQELVNLWANISQQNPTTFSELCNQTLWNNSFITTLGKSIFYKDFIDKNMSRTADLLTDSGNFLSWQMARQKYNLRNKDIMKWFSLIASVPMSWKVEIRNYFSSIENTCTSCTLTIPQTKVSLLPDTSVKAAYKILVRPLVKAPTSQKSLENLLCRQDLDWASIYMIPRTVTVESKPRIFQYKLLNNILYSNDGLYKMGIVQTPLCSLCKQEKETVIHLLCQCHVTRQLWCSLNGWLQGVLRLPPLEPVTAMLRSWDLKNEANVLLNHLMLLFKYFIYRFRNMNTSVNLCHLQHFILLVQKVEQKIAFRNNRLTHHFSKWDPILQMLN